MNKALFTGVLAVSGDNKFGIKAKSVIIATGGFGANKALLKKLCPQYYEDMPLAGFASDGRWYPDGWGSRGSYG